MKNTQVSQNPNVCPWWVGLFLASPMRKLLQDPYKILGSYVSKDMKVADVGCALGFFSFPMMDLVGANGRVYCFDVQKSMLKTLEKKVQRRENFMTCPTLHQSDFDQIGLKGYGGDFDFILAFAVVHEVPDQSAFMAEIYSNLKIGGKLLISEPVGHVSKKSFEETLSIAKALGFTLETPVEIKRSRSILAVKSSVGQI